VNILVAGVGGQGVLLFADILSSVALTAGLDVKKSEVHGMAQRGGSVTSHIRYASRVHSPIIEEGTADMIVAFEKMEALRCIHFLAANGRLLYDSHRIQPLTVQIGMVDRPDEDHLTERIRIRAASHLEIPAFQTAVSLGSSRTQNTVMLGAASHYLEFPADAFRAAIRGSVRPQILDLNLKAFDAGLALTDRS
jgi:indolepyruvate ferredoxin oxidoreductase beta subunit